MLTKLLPMLMVGGGAYQNKDKLAQLLSVVEVVATQTEMSNICKVIKLDSITGDIPPTEADEFAKYLRQNIKSENGQGTRDFSKDLWGTAYTLVIKNNIATVVSAGPDKKYVNKDDLKASTDLF